MEPEQTNLAALFPAIAAQMRGALSNLHLAAAQLAPESAREQDPRLDARAAVLDQSYYQLLRLVNALSAAARLSSDLPLSLEDRDIVELVSEICQRAGAPGPPAGSGSAVFLSHGASSLCLRPGRAGAAALSPALQRLQIHSRPGRHRHGGTGGAARDGFCCGVSDTGCRLLKNVLHALRTASAPDCPHRRPTAWGWD